MCLEAAELAQEKLGVSAEVGYWNEKIGVLSCSIFFTMFRDVRRNVFFCVFLITNTFLKFSLMTYVTTLFLGHRLADDSAMGRGSCG